MYHDKFMHKYRGLEESVSVSGCGYDRRVWVSQKK